LKERFGRRVEIFVWQVAAQDIENDMDHNRVSLLDSAGKQKEQHAIMQNITTR
jgi:hypothetical protein